MTGNAAYPLFSVSQYTTFPLSFDQDVALYRDLGIEAIEICEEKLCDDPRVARRQLAGVRDSGLKVTSVQPKIHSPFPHRATAEGDPIEHSLTVKRSEVSALSGSLASTVEAIQAEAETAEAPILLDDGSTDSIPGLFDPVDVRVRRDEAQFERQVRPARVKSVAL